MRLIQSFVGLLIILVSLVAIAISIAGAIYAGNVVDGLGDSLSAITDITYTSIDTAEDSLVLAQETVAEVNNTLQTIERTALDVAQTLTDTQPLLIEANAIVAESVPDSIDALNDATPNLIQVADAVDETLTTLSGVKIEETIPIINYDISFDFGIIDYNPDAPFAQSIEDVVGGFEGIPEQLRGLGDDLETASGNLETLSGDVVVISDDLNALNEQIALVPDQLDGYVGILRTVESDLSAVETQFENQLNTVRLGIVLFMVWFGLLQLAPLVVGWHLLRGRALGHVDLEDEDEFEEIPEHDSEE